jgi:hypothetical protein
MKKDGREMAKVSYENLMKSRYDVTSQNGENGLISKICEIIGFHEKTCIEFGAWDGVYLSNVYHLWHDQNWAALLIEANKKRYKELLHNTKGYNVSSINCFVQDTGSKNLTSVAEQAGFTGKWNVLSIDIDGNEYALLESLDLKHKHTKLIVVEFNNSIPPHIHYVREGGNFSGSSALAFVNLMKKKGYELVCNCGVNLFFIEKTAFEKNFDFDNDLAKIFDYSNISYLMSDYGGNLICNRLPDHTSSGTGIIGLIKQIYKWIRYPHARKDSYNGKSILRKIQIINKQKFL